MSAKRIAAKVLKWTTIAAAGLLAFLVVLLWIATGTQVGARMVISFIEGRSLGIHVENVQGKLAGPLFLRDVQYESDLATVSIEQITFDWKFLSLVKRRLHIDSLRVSGIDALVNLPSDTTAQTVSGDTVAAAEPAPFEPPLDVIFDMIEVERAVAQVPDLVTASIQHFGVNGSLDSYALSANATLTGPNVPETHVRLNADGDMSELEIDSLAAELLEGRVHVSGSASWFPEITWSLVTTVDSVEPGLLATDSTLFPGVLSLTASTEGRLEDDGPRGAVALDTLHGFLREQIVAGSASAAFESSSYAISDVNLHWGQAYIEGRASIAELIEADFDVNAPDLEAMYPSAGGSLIGQIQANGLLKTPQISGSFEGRDLVFAENAIRYLDGTMNIDLAGEGLFEMNIRALEGSAGTVGIDSVAAIGDGTLAEHRVELKIATAEADVSAAISGGVRDSTWFGTIANLDIGSELGDWILENQADLRVARDGGELETLCLTSPNGRACASGAWDADGSAQLTAALDSLLLNTAGPFLPPELSITGAISADVDLVLSADRSLTVNVDAITEDGEIRYLIDGQEALLQHHDGHLAATVDSAGTHAELGISLLMEGTQIASLAGRATLPSYHNLDQIIVDQNLAAQFNASVTTLEPFTTFVPRVDSIDGQLFLDASVVGTVGEPRPEWVMTFDSGLVSVPEFGLLINDITARAEGDSLDGLIATATAHSGPGQIEFLIESPFKPTAESAASIEVRGERFQAVNTPTTEVQISPDLSMVYTGDSVSLTGEVVVPIGMVELTRIPEMAVPVSPDVVIVGADTTEEAPMLAVSTDVTLQLSDSVSFSGFGLTSWLSGGVHAIQHPGDAPTGSGEIVIDSGSYRAYGQDLDIDRGRVAFTGGPVDNPGLDIRATRTADDGTVAGLQIRGPLQNPEFLVFAEPAMAEADALSYIVLGRRYDDASGSDRDLVRSAATSLGLQGGNAIAGSVGRRVGLDETRIETESGTLEDASLVAGKYLSPKLFVSYGVGLFDAANTLRVRYLLSRLFTVQAETGAATSSDVLFRIELGGENEN
jgi:translocation and assembly module TamB